MENEIAKPETPAIETAPAQPEAPPATPAAETIKAPALVPDTPPPPITATAAQVVMPLETPPVPPQVPTGNGKHDWQCPACGRGGFESRSRLIHHHIRRVHKTQAGELEKLLPPTPAGSRGRPPGRPPGSAGEPAPAQVPGVDEAPAAPPDFSDIENPAGEQPAPLLAKVVNYGKMAEMSFDMSIALLARVFGPEWQPQSPDERGAMVESIKVYYESKQLPDIPPGAMLCFMVAMYSAPRLAQPSTRNKLQLAWLWVKTKIFRRKAVPPPKLSVL